MSNDLYAANCNAHERERNCNAHERERNCNAHERERNCNAHERERNCNAPELRNDRFDVTMEPRASGVHRGADMQGTDLFAIETKGDKVNKPYYVYVRINNRRVKMEIDTGAAVSVISEKLYRRRFHKVKLSPANCILKTYSKESLELKGKITVQVKCNEQTTMLELMIVKGDGPSLMGRDWSSRLNLNWSQLNKLSVSSETVDQLCDRYASVFQPDLGMLKGISAKLHVVKDAVPKFCKPRTVPYALKQSVEKELCKLEKEGVISPVSYSEWAAPIVCIPKKDDSVRICGDYKVTINPWLEVDQYPLPRTQDLFTKLSGGQKFTKLDLSQAYQQVPLEESSKRYLTVNTQKGLYIYNRLPYGVASAPAIFQKIMDQILQGMEGVICYLDDILITGKDTKQHMENLEEVLKRLQASNLRVRREKCLFFQSSVSYLGHVIDSDGIHPMKEKTDAIKKAAIPENVTELRSFLALLNYYGKFIPNLSTIIKPMTELLHKDIAWSWSENCQAAFEDAKRHLMSNQVLIHFDPDLPLILACDASPVGVGAVISHRMSDGSERPIAFASRMLTKTERNYSQIKKEALGLVFGVMKFHEYLFGRQFILVTDHKPLLKILGPKTGVPTLAAARMQRWSLILSAYKYEIQYKRSEHHGNADALSRLPLKNEDVRSNPVYRLSYLDELPVTAVDIAQTTETDPVLKKVKDYVMSGWPKHIVEEKIKPYFAKKFELSVEHDCLLWGYRVVIPETLRDRLLAELHDSHWGMVKMKSLARSYFWWPTLDMNIEEIVSQCSVCQQQRSMPTPVPVHTWKWSTGPWERIHLDFAEDHQQMLLVVMDAHARWPEIFPMQSTTSAKTIEVLRNLFASYGLPQEVVTDNGPQFTSREFDEFLLLNGVKHTKSPAYHPASNGLAERLVQNLKKHLQKTEQVVV
nr:uncharacterized protein K02A2.6-like [Misgurnus anguillicaudatus]